MFKYFDQLDTVRTKSTNKLKLINKEIGEKQLMLSVLHNEIPILSQTQAFDSGIIIESAKSNKFLNLLRTGRIRCAFHKCDNLKDAFLKSLERGIKTDKKDKDKLFEYSLDKYFQEGSINDLFDKRKQTIEFVKTGKEIDNKNVQEKLNIIMQIDDAIETAKNDRGIFRETEKQNKYKINDLIFYFLSFVNEPSYSFDNELLNLFNDLYNSPNNEDRSFLYKAIEKRDIEDYKKEKAKDIINYYYNAVVGYSVLGNDNMCLTLPFSIKSTSTTLGNYVEKALNRNRPDPNEFKITNIENLKPITWEVIWNFVTNFNYEQYLNDPKMNKEIISELSKYIARDENSNIILSVLKPAKKIAKTLGALGPSILTYVLSPENIIIFGLIILGGQTLYWLGDRLPSATYFKQKKIEKLLLRGYSKNEE